jgi:hypothetical protein
MRMTTLYAALAGAFLLGTAALSPAQTTGNPPAGSTLTNPVKNATVAMSADYRAEKDRIEAEEKADKAKCKTLSANAKDVCMKEAKAKEKIAKAELEAKRKGTPHAQYEVMVTKAKQMYEVAKEKCDDLKGAEKSACKKQAKADEEKALAEAKASRSTVAAATTTKPATTNSPMTTPAPAPAAPSTAPATPAKKY